MVLMAATKSSFLDKVLARIGRLDPEGLQTVVQRLARERNFLETLFNTIEDGVLVVDEQARIVYFNLAVTNLLGLKAQHAEGQPVRRYLPDLNWKELSARDRAGGQQIVRHEFEVNYPQHRFLRLYAAPLDGEATGSSGMVLKFIPYQVPIIIKGVVITVIIVSSFTTSPVWFDDIFR